jgi:hypothetical protein
MVFAGSRSAETVVKAKSGMRKDCFTPYKPVRSEEVPLRVIFRHPYRLPGIAREF